MIEIKIETVKNGQIIQRAKMMCAKKKAPNCWNSVGAKQDSTTTHPVPIVQHARRTRKPRVFRPLEWLGLDFKRERGLFLGLSAREWIYTVLGLIGILAALYLVAVIEMMMGVA